MYEDDPTLAPGEEKVKTSPYTGYKYRTYRNLYGADGKLISSAYEATSDYKARNRVILRGPALEEEPDTPAGNPGELPENPSGETGTDPGAGDSGGTGAQTRSRRRDRRRRGDPRGTVRRDGGGRLRTPDRRRRRSGPAAPGGGAGPGRITA